MNSVFSRLYRKGFRSLRLSIHRFEKVWIWQWKCAFMVSRTGGEIQAILLQYYNGMHLYSGNGNFDPADAAEVIREQKPAMVCGMKETIEKLQPFFPNKNWTGEGGSTEQVYRNSWWKGNPSNTRGTGRNCGSIDDGRSNGWTVYSRFTL